MDVSLLAELNGLTVISLQSIGSQAELRREWRVNANTGNLIGVVFRERNKDRKAVRYVGKRSKGERKEEYQRYANGFRGGRANGSSIGNAIHGGEGVGKARNLRSVDGSLSQKQESSYLH
jgi:hypothetical protein